MARLLRGLGLVLALVLPVMGPLAPAPAAAQARAQTRAEAPLQSPLPPARPARAGTQPGVSVQNGVLVRSPLPVRRPGAASGAPPAQVPPNMVPAGTPGQAPQIALIEPPQPPAPPAAFDTPEVPIPMGPAVTVTEGAPGLRPVRRGTQPVVEGLPDGQVAPVPRPARIAVPAQPAPEAPAEPGLEAGPGAAPDLAGPIDPRAVARSLVPAPRTAASRRRFEAAFAAIQTRRERPQVVAAAQPVAQPPRAGEPQGAGLCGVPGLQGRRLPRVTSQVAGCGIDEPVSLTHVHGVRLSPAATLHCDAARATGRWVQDVVQPAIGRQGGGVVEMRLGSHYACRTRNSQRGARISEHGRGRAIDIMSFRLANGETVTVLRDYARGPYSAALRRMRQGACGIFRTTLGPGSDRFHADHFHFDVAQHRSGGTFCR